MFYFGLSKQKGVSVTVLHCAAIFYSALQKGLCCPTHFAPSHLLEGSFRNIIPEANYNSWVPKQLSLWDGRTKLFHSRQVPSFHWEHAEGQWWHYPFSHATTKHWHLCAVAFLSNQLDPIPGQGAQPSTCTWKLWSRQFLTQKLPKNKGKDLAAVNKEQFMLFLLATTFAVPHETYLGNTNCLLSAENFPKLTSL